MSENELMHHGRKGMKWYQHIFGDSDTRAKYSSAYREGSNIASQARTAVGAAGRIKATSKQKDISKMSDSELRALVNRMGMEQQYSQLSSSRVSKGQSYIMDTLTIAGSALATTSSALTIALMIRKLKE